MLLLLLLLCLSLFFLWYVSGASLICFSNLFNKTYHSLLQLSSKLRDLYRISTVWPSFQKKERARIPCDSPRGGFSQVHIPGLKCFTAKPCDTKELLDLLAVFEVKSYWLTYEGCRQKSRESTSHSQRHHIIATCMIHLPLMYFHLHAVYADYERCLWMPLFFFVAAKAQQFQQSWLGTGKVSEGPLNETAACDAARFLQKVSVSSLGQWWRSRVLPRLCWTSWRSLCPWRVPKGRKVGVFWLLTPFHALKKEMITAVQTWLYFHRTQRGGFRRNNFKAAKERITPQWPPLVCWNPRLFAAHWSWQTCQLKVPAAGRAPVRFQFHQTQKISKAFVAATPKLWKTLPMQWTQSQSLTQSLYALVFELLMYYENPRFGNSRSKALKHINRV